jgi:hypothetical protein
VHICLVAGVEHDAVGRGAEHAVYRDGQLDGAQIGAEVTAVAHDVLHQDGPNLGGQLAQLRPRQVTQVGRPADAFEDAHVRNLT